MRPFLLGSVVLLLPATLWTATLRAQAIAIRGVTVIDVAAGSALRDRTVVIEGERITTLGTTGSVALPRGTRKSTPRKTRTPPRA